MTSPVTDRLPPAAPADSVVVVRSWAANSNGVEQQVLAVRAPKSRDDATPWMVYVNGTFVGSASEDRIPASAETLFPRRDADGRAVQEQAIDGVYYEVLVDGRPGIGVRNGPLTPEDLNLPWVVSMGDSHGVRRLLDAVSDAQVRVLRRVPTTTPPAH